MIRDVGFILLHVIPLFLFLVPGAAPVLPGPAPSKPCRQCRGLGAGKKLGLHLPSSASGFGEVVSELWGCLWARTGTAASVMALPVPQEWLSRGGDGQLSF